jgi:hypothetical protein
MTDVKNLIIENEGLKARNEFLERCVKALKLNNAKITLERNKALDELHEIKQLSMFEFGNLYCSSESLEADGHAFARALLGKPMTEEEFIANGEAEYERTWNLACDGDDY